MNLSNGSKLRGVQKFRGKDSSWKSKKSIGRPGERPKVPEGQQERQEERTRVSP